MKYVAPDLQRARDLQTSRPTSDRGNDAGCEFDRNLPIDSLERKTYPIATGFLDYFPDATAEVAFVSWVGNQKHNPGQPLHWARGKSADHADCVARHLIQRGGFDMITIGDKVYKVRHTAALAWRAMALCQEEIEAEKKLPPSRGSK